MACLSVTKPQLLQKLNPHPCSQVVAKIKIVDLSVVLLLPNISLETLSFYKWRGGKNLDPTLHCDITSGLEFT
jgi:hypothetical protein